MTRKQALTDLLAKVEAGEFDARTYPLMKLPQMSIDVFDGIHAAHNGSLDAAKALHEAVLPGWAWSIQDNGEQTVFPPNDHPQFEQFPDGVWAIGTRTKPARAWLAAVLKALISECEDE